MYDCYISIQPFLSFCCTWKSLVSKATPSFPHRNRGQELPAGLKLTSLLIQTEAYCRLVLDFFLPH
uniref:Uncharacterized protein n=1 Tax=Arundo donax TaxID=35708 RepID=A0A0A9AVF0_ARUDO